MTTYNVRYTVVALIEADSERDALENMRAQLWRAGFEPYEEVGFMPDAFESEEQRA